jgi:multiple sugar transport system ATP-binding protein
VTQIVMKGIRKSYGDHEVIKGLDLTVESGEFMVFVGPSGCGKSTLLRMVAGLEDISGGDMLVDGVRINDVAPSERGGAMVFQNYALYPHMTVGRNIGFAMEVAGASKAEIAKAVARTAEILNIGHLLDSRPKALSGGERQRVAMGRAIVRKPKFFLFDEPLSNLDAALRVQLRIELLRLHQELKTTMIYVTHDQVEAMTMGTRIAIFRKGLLEQVGAPMALYSHPANTFVAGFLGSPSINMLPCRSLDDQRVLLLDTHEFTLDPGLPEALRPMASIGLRPEDMRLDLHEGIPGEVVLTENLGDQVIVHVRMAGSPKLVTARHAAGQFDLRKGQLVRLVPDLRKALYFDKDLQNLAPRGVSASKELLPC